MHFNRQSSFFPVVELSPSPRHGSLQTESCCTSRSAGRAGASSCLVTTPSRLQKHRWKKQKWFWDNTSTLLHSSILQHLDANTSMLTKIHCLAAPWTDIGSSREGGETRSWKKKTKWIISHVSSYFRDAPVLIRFSSSLPAVSAPAPL